MRLQQLQLSTERLGKLKARAHNKLMILYKSVKYGWGQQIEFGLSICNPLFDCKSYFLTQSILVDCVDLHGVWVYINHLYKSGFLWFKLIRSNSTHHCFILVFLQKHRYDVLYYVNIKGGHCLHAMRQCLIAVEELFQNSSTNQGRVLSLEMTGRGSLLLMLQFYSRPPLISPKWTV